jgi:hypothetical protein
MNNQQKGRIFEDRIHKILISTKLLVYREKEVKSNYANHITGIDHLIMNDDICIAIQDKYVKSKKPSNVDIHHFKTSVNDLYKIIKRKIIGVYLSLMSPTQPALNSFNFENKHGDNSFLFINDPDEEILVEKFIEFLYENKVYLYDEEDVFMLGDKHSF